MKEVSEYLQNKLKPNDKIVVAVSGGPDSMCLLELLFKLQKTMKLTLICAHVNHNIRPESEEEARFVKKIATKYGCIYEYMKIEKYPKENFESSARKKRYHFFDKVVKKYKANYLMTAHHGDDLMETILMRLVRGSNLNGYAGFKKETNYDTYELLRPLIHTTKADIDLYNKENNIEYRIDKSNESDDYTRNRYRHQILPILKKENKNVHRKFLKFSEEMYNIEKFLEKETKNALTNVLEFDKVNLTKLNELDLVLKKRVIEYILKQEYQNDINCINEKHVQKIMEVCLKSKANLYIDLPKKRRVVKNYNSLYLKQKNKDKKEKILLEDCVILGDKQKITKLSSCNIKKSNYILRLNSSEIEFPLFIRYRNIGDTMEIKNLGGKKKVKDIFINEKIPLDKRDTWPILVDNKDTILWIPGVKKSKFDKNVNELYDIIYKYVISEEI